MGKASKWFRSILGLKKRDTHHQPSTSKAPHNKRRWSFVKSYREKDSSATTNNSSNSDSNAKSSSLYGDQQQKKDSVSVIDRGCEVVDPNKHAIAVAAATAAVAEAAVVAAQAAAAVVRLTSRSSRCAHEPAAHVSSSCGAREEFAAIKIQSSFRGYLARRALRALKGLVRLQALVRGHIERKRTAEWFRRMQALLRAQARARAGRSQISESSQSSSKSSHFHHPGPPTPEKFENAIRSKSKKYEQSSMLKRNGSKSSGRTLDNEKLHPGWNRSERWIDEQSWDQPVHSTGIGPMDDEKNDKILEVDTGKPHFTSKDRNLFHSTHLVLNSDLYSCSFTNSRDSHQTVPSPLSGEVQSPSPVKSSHEVEESPFCDAYNSPQFYSASSKGGSSKRSPFTPARSDGSRSYLSGYSDHPNYMTYTESSRAKLRSLSAPKQRPQYERSSSTKRYSIHGFGELKSNTQRSALHANFGSKAYPGSGRLDRLGMSVGYGC
ncbi:hypothetical protein CRYUN_Cryun19dG0128500 [Craigia yunnanensis]